jgi:hypothetical protein
MQHWIKDMKYSTRVKDEEGYPAMALVNKATGEALKHSLGQSHPVSISVRGYDLCFSFHPNYNPFCYYLWKCTLHSSKMMIYM